MSSPDETALPREERHPSCPEATSDLLPLLYGELRRIAATLFRRERAGHTLRPTEVVHEAYFRLIKPGKGRWKSRHHFLGVAARAMREVLVDYARAHGAQKRGSTLIRVDWDDAIIYSTEQPGLILAVDEALTRLAKLSRRQSRIVELRVFGGLSVREIAAVLRIGVTAVKEDWALAKAWLQRELEGCR